MANAFFCCETCGWTWVEDGKDKCPRCSSPMFIFDCENVAQDHCEIWEVDDNNLVVIEKEGDEDDEGSTLQ